MTALPEHPARTGLSINEMILYFVNAENKCVLMGDSVFASSLGVNLRDESGAFMSMGLGAGSGEPALIFLPILIASSLEPGRIGTTV